MADYSSRRVSETPVATKYVRERTAIFADTLAFDALTVATKFLRGDESYWYSMRAWNTSLSAFVYWKVPNRPDFTGARSGYPVVDIQDAVVVKVEKS